jgi:dephospho-CoA kinase
MVNMIAFGLTGGIACGKSTVTKTFRKHGFPIIDADIIARQVVDVGTHGYFSLLKAFGKEFFNDDGSLNRTALGNLVFSEKTAMKKINDIVGPLIQDESFRQIQRWFLYLSGQGKDLIVGYDAALICEMGNAKKYRPLIVVSCPQDMQIQRLMSRNSLTREQAMSRINAQMPVAEKAAMADYVIDTSGTVEYSILQTEGVIQHLKKKYNAQ